MSWEVQKDVRAHTVGCGICKSILLDLADYASKDGTGIWPSKDTIARSTEFSLRTVQKHISELVARGLISEAARRKCSNGYTTEYRINLDAVLSLPHSQNKGAGARELKPTNDSEAIDAEGEPVQRTHPTPAQGAPQEVQELHPNLKKTIKEPIVLDSSSPEEASFTEFWNVYPRKHDQERSRRLFEDAVKSGVDAEWIISAAKTYRNEQQGNEERYICYSDNWLEKKRWEDFPWKREPIAESSGSSGGPQDLEEFWAEKIKNNAYVPQSAISPQLARNMLDRDLVTIEELRRKGLAW